MGAFLHFLPKSGFGLPTVIWFDVVTEEQHHLKNEITSHPVEEGAEITDHVRPDVDKVTLSVFVSNEPIATLPEVMLFTKKPIAKTVGAQVGAPVPHVLDVKEYEPPLLPTPGAALNAISNAVSNLLFGKKPYVAMILTFPTAFDNVQSTYDELRKVRDEAIRVDVVTSTRTYKDMILENMEMARSADTGTGATFTLEMKQVRLVSTLKVAAVLPVDTSGFSRKDLGAKGGSPADDPALRVSILAQAGKSAGIF